MHLGPLGHRDARTLLESVLPAPLDEQVLERLILETRGNPLALLELPRGLTSSQLAGGFGVPAAAPMHAGIEESFLSRVDALPGDACLLVLIAASEPTGDPALVWRAAERLGIPESAGLAAESTGVVAFQPGIAFRHPLVRSAVYRSASATERGQVHHALAEATDPDVDPDRRAWHRAQAAVMPDEALAAALEESAARAQSRGGFAGAAVFLERSAALTPEPGRRAPPGRWQRHRRNTTPGRLTTRSPSSSVPRSARSMSSSGPRRRSFGRGIAFATNRGSAAPGLLLTAARRLEPLEVPLARETYLDALTAAMFTGRLAGASDARQVAAAALVAPFRAESAARGPAPRRPGDADRPRTRGGNAAAPGRARRPSPAAESNRPKRCAGDGWRAGRRDSSGTIRDGTC